MRDVYQKNSESSILAMQAPLITTELPAEKTTNHRILKEVWQQFSLARAILQQTSSLKLLLLI